MPGRVDLRAVARGKECKESANRLECESTFMSGWPVEPRYLHGFNHPCVWEGSYCNTGARVPCSSLHDWHRCPRLRDTWLELPGHPSSGSRWTCTSSGEWEELGRKNEPSAPHLLGAGVDRSRGFSMSKEQCMAFPWRSRDVTWQARARRPAIFGLDHDVRRELEKINWAYAVLAMDMFTAAARSNDSQRPVLWTPCTNLAFTMCALRGYLANAEPQFAEGSAGRLYLATKGADVLRRCRPDVLVKQLLHSHTKCSGSSCRRFDATWVRALPSPLGHRTPDHLRSACALPTQCVSLHRTSATSPSRSIVPLRVLAKMDTRSGTRQASGCVALTGVEAPAFSEVYGRALVSFLIIVPCWIRCSAVSSSLRLSRVQA